MTRKVKRVTPFSSLHLKNAMTLEGLSDDLEVPLFRAIDVLVEEWNELNSARSFREKQQAETIQKLNAKVTSLESQIKVISATTHQILQFHQAQHSVENRFKNSSNLSRAK